MYNPANRKIRSVRRKWPAIAIGIVAVLIAAATIALYFIPNKPGNWVTELYTAEFAASSEGFAFLHVQANLKSELVVYSMPERKITIHRPQFATIWSLSANPAKNGNFLVSYWRPITPDRFRSGEQAPMKLLQCGIVRCTAFFEFAGSINSAIDLGNGELFFIGAKPHVTQRGWPGSREFVGFPIREFYFRSRESRIVPITDWESVLGSASLGGDRIVFNFYPSPLLGKPIPHPPVYPRTSDIWAARVTYKDGIPHVAFDGDRPFIAHGKNLDTKPSISPDGNRTAFLSSSGYTANKGWRYDVIVVDNA